MEELKPMFKQQLFPLIFSCEKFTISICQTEKVIFQLSNFFDVYSWEEPHSVVRLNFEAEIFSVPQVYLRPDVAEK